MATVESAISPEISVAYQTYLDMLYEDISGFEEENEQDHKLTAQRKEQTTYGELLYAGFKKLTKYLTLSEEDVFYDFGSGVGKLVYQFFMHTPVKAAIGLEACRPRHLEALGVLRRFKKEIPDFFNEGRKCQFLNNDFLKTAIKDATVIYVCSTCFSERLIRQIATKINKEAKKIRYVISLDPMENLRIPFFKEIKVKCCWDKAMECYIYKADQ